MADDTKLRIKAIEEMIQVVLLAIPTEITARDMYLKAAGKAVSEESKKLFLLLAEQEQGHEAQLRFILEDLRQELGRIKSGG
jgi:rubrerythrin